MKPWIENLLALQKVDMRIINLNLRLKMIPVEIKKLQEKQSEAEKKLAEAKSSMQKTVLDLKQTESAIAEVNKKIAQLQQQSSLVKKNTEYQAMLTQIDGQKEKISELETQMLLLYDRDEENREKFKEIEKEFNAEKGGIADDIEELRELAGEIQGEIKELLAGRPALEKKIDSDILVQYRRLLKTDKAPLGKVNSAGICSNCHLKITPQTLTETMKGTVVYCDNCSCLLYLDK
ncbi:MAG: C4-type zinc ribbon domain-containing protein [Victivallales bacterium]|nr:C4-type zinc ribbon domain-containing protein [Victivallales bacterium]